MAIKVCLMFSVLTMPVLETDFFVLFFYLQIFMLSFDIQYEISHNLPSWEHKSGFMTWNKIYFLTENNCLFNFELLSVVWSQDDLKEEQASLFHL